MELLVDPQTWIAFATLTALERVLRIGLLLVLAWIVGSVAPLFTVLGQEISGRDLILIGGGLFLFWKSTGEIHQSIAGEEAHGGDVAGATFAAVILQIMVVDRCSRWTPSSPRWAWWTTCAS